MFSAGILDINSCFIKYNQATFTVVVRFLFTVDQGYVLELSVHVYGSLFHCSWCPDFYNLILLIYYLMTMAMTLNLKKRVQSWNNKTWARFWGSDLGNQHLLVPSMSWIVHFSCTYIWQMLPHLGCLKISFLDDNESPIFHWTNTYDIMQDSNVWLAGQPGLIIRNMYYNSKASSD